MLHKVIPALILGASNIKPLFLLSVDLFYVGTRSLLTHSGFDFPWILHKVIHALILGASNIKPHYLLSRSLLRWPSLLTLVRTPGGPHVCI
jgi:hypothetical protein